MRKLVLLLALLLPLQFAWAGVTAYCQHETTLAQQRHFGHHEHVHQAAGEKTGEVQLAGDNDCGICHAAGSAMLPDQQTPTATAPSSSTYEPGDRRRLPTAPTRAPDRPQWPRLA